MRAGATARVGLAPLVLLLGCPPKHEYPDGRGLQGQLEKEVVALQLSVERLEEEAASCRTGGGRPDQLYAELVQVLPNDVQVAHEGRVTTILVPDAHLFGSDGLGLRAEARITLDMVATALQSHDGYTMLIESHTADVHYSPDVARQYPSLWDLSYVHARTVQLTFIREFKLDEERFALAARGPAVPLTSNDTTAGQNQNRRVVLYIFPPGVRR